MLFHCASYFKQMIPFINVIHYVSVRTILALISSLLLSLWWGPFFIQLSYKFFRSQSRPWTPDNHRAKDDMPTMGGIFITTIVATSALLWCNWSNSLLWISLFCLIGFGAIGAWDDWNKICYNKGISVSKKLIAQLIVSFLISASWIYFINPSKNLYFPFFKNIHPELGFLFIPWVMFVLIGTSNAVNLTDGLDGLAIGGLFSNFSVFSIICYSAGHLFISHYLNIPFTGTSELTILGGALIGASLGFLWFNTHPAQIFMGDVGSLSLGGVLAFMALACKQELILPLAGGIFVIETLSVIIQIFSFKIYGKRWFKMAPIHHHFELMGWPESKITIRFYILDLELVLKVEEMLIIKYIVIHTKQFNKG